MSTTNPATTQNTNNNNNTTTTESALPWQGDVQDIPPEVKEAIDHIRKGLYDMHRTLKAMVIENDEAQRQTDAELKRQKAERDIITAQFKQKYDEECLQHEQKRLQMREEMKEQYRQNREEDLQWQKQWRETSHQVDQQWIQFQKEMKEKYPPLTSSLQHQFCVAKSDDYKRYSQCMANIDNDNSGL